MSKKDLSEKQQINLSDLVAQVAKDTQYYRDDVKLVLESAFRVIGKDLHNGQRVMLKNFGAFNPTLTKERVIVHPVTEELYTLKPHYIVKFSPSDKFFEEVAYGGSEGREEYLEKPVR